VLVYLGEISYSTYMVHYLVYDLLKAGFMSKPATINPLYVWLSFAAGIPAVGAAAPYRRYAARSATSAGAVASTARRNRVHTGSIADERT
jgi:peptidoglycan/LPS O-acetylase OafA/YrhL